MTNDQFNTQNSSKKNGLTHTDNSDSAQIQCGETRPSIWA